MMWWHLATAGLGSLIFHWGVGIGIIVICILLEIFTQELGMIPLIGPFIVRVLTPLRKDLLWAAGCTAAIMIAYGIGIHDEANRCNAKQAVVEKTVTKVITKAQSPQAKKAKDPYDDPNN